MNKMFKFVNLDMNDDIVDVNGKILSYKEINCIATTEEEARSKISLPKNNLTKGRLDDNWVLMMTTQLGMGWYSK